MTVTDSVGSDRVKFVKAMRHYGAPVKAININTDPADYTMLLTVAAMDFYGNVQLNGPFIRKFKQQVKQQDSLLIEQVIANIERMDEFDCALDSVLQKIEILREHVDENAIRAAVAMHFMDFTKIT